MHRSSKQSPLYKESKSWMASASMSTSTMPHARRKIVTYGKKRAPVFNFLDDEPPTPKKPTQTDIGRHTVGSSSSPPARLKSIAKPQNHRPGAPQPSVFDVPSSEDESHSPTRRPQKPTSAPKPRQVELPQKTTGARGRNPKTSRQVVPTAAASKDVFDIPTSEDERDTRKKVATKEDIGSPRKRTLANGTGADNKTSTTVDTKRLRQVPGVSDVLRDSDDSTTTGKSRKRKSWEHTLANQASSDSRSPVAKDDLNRPESASKGYEHSETKNSIALSTRDSLRDSNDFFDPMASEKATANTMEASRKRRKATPNPPALPEPPLKTGSNIAVACRKPIPGIKKNNPASGQRVPTVSTHSTYQFATSNNGRRIRPGSSPRKQIEKATSSPAALEIPLRLSTKRMGAPVATTTNLLDVEFETEYDLLPSDQKTNAQRSTSPMDIDGHGSVTPRQKKLWSNLLTDNNSSASPSQLEISKLQLTERAFKTKTVGNTVQNLNADGFGKRRLIDRLAQSQHASDDEMSSDDEVQTSSLIPESKEAEHGNTTVQRTPTKLERRVSSTLKGIQGGTKITYAKQRSHLEESMVDGVDILGAMTMDSPILAKPTGSSWSQPTFSTTKDFSQMDMDDDDLSDSGNAMKSIHELRAAGSNRRFRNDVDALFEDLDQPLKSSKSSLRSAMIDLATKIADKDFASRLLDNGLSQRIFNSSVESYGKDPILGFAFSAVVGFILNAEKSSAVLLDIRSSGTLRSLAQMLDYKDDIVRIAKERRINMSRMAQNSVKDLHNLVQASSLWTGTPPVGISPRLLALRCLELSTRALRKSGDREELLAQKPLKTILDIAQASSSCSLTGSVSPYDQRCVYYSLSIALDTMLGEAASEIWTSGNLQTLQGMVASFLDTPPRFGEKVEFLATKLCLNLTNNNAEISELFASPDIVQSFLRSIDRRFKLLAGPLDPIERTVTLDHLILGLGAMINLAEFSDSARTAVVAEGDVLLNAILRIYLDGRERVLEADSIEESHGNVAYGYLTVLMANLCHNQDVRRKLRSKLPQGNLTSLIHGLEEFINLQMLTNRMDMRNSEGQEIWSSYTERLRSVGDQLRQFEEAA